MNQIALANQDSIDCIGEIPSNLAHPQPVRRKPDPTQLHLARRKLDEKQNREPSGVTQNRP